jgi:hypothetical protein
MTRADTLLLALFIRLLKQRNGNMPPLDFSKLQASVANLSSDATALQAQAAASNDTTNQAAINALVTSTDNIHAQLQTFLPQPAAEAPAEEPAQ